jgi:hypothetical protein
MTSLFYAVNRILRPTGLCVIRISEIRRMDEDARDYSKSIYSGKNGVQKSYFNGLSDYASKTANRIWVNHISPHKD